MDHSQCPPRISQVAAFRFLTFPFWLRDNRNLPASSQLTGHPGRRAVLVANFWEAMWEANTPEMQQVGKDRHIGNTGRRRYRLPVRPFGTTPECVADRMNLY